jgi:hypothetical protein
VSAVRNWRSAHWHGTDIIRSASCASETHAESPFESLDAINVQARVDDAAWLSRLHRASTELARSTGNKQLEITIGTHIRQPGMLPEMTHHMPGRAHLTR